MMKRDEAILKWNTFLALELEENIDRVGQNFINIFNTYKDK